MAKTTRDDVSTALRPLVRERAIGAAFALVVVSGPDTGATFLLDGSKPPRVLLGTSPSCDIVLTDPFVSRRHAAFELGGGDLVLSDLGAKNGSFINGISITEARLRGGELLVFGETQVRVDPAPQANAEPGSTAIRFGRLLGASPQMRRLYPIVERLGQTAVPVIIGGETGTGKELLAEAIHETSARAKGPFVVFDCTTVSAQLVESELFGHERGAFTGADATRRGVFEQADGGTLLIDEIGDLDIALQAKLLRVIERSELRRVGGSKWVNVDVRVLAATRRDLDREVQEGRFRDDLFFRLAVGHVELPPLRKRAGDIPFLAEHFWITLGGDPGAVPHDLFRRFEEHPWPGNVRELHNAISRRIAMGDLEPDDEPRSLDNDAQASDAIEEALALDLPFARAREVVMGHFERRYVARVLEKHGGNVARAAAASGIARRYFQIIRARQSK